MYTTKVWTIAAICVAAYAAPHLASAQQPAKAVAPPPPQMQKLEEGSADANVTIRKQEAEKPITEKRQQGKVTEIKVKSGGSTYYLRPNEGAGNAMPGDGQSSDNRAAQWQILEFDMGRQNKEAKDAKDVPPATDLPAKAN